VKRRDDFPADFVRLPIYVVQEAHRDLYAAPDDTSRGVGKYPQAQ
jgi:hypothetical protein